MKLQEFGKPLVDDDLYFLFSVICQGIQGQMEWSALELVVDLTCGRSLQGRHVQVSAELCDVDVGGVCCDDEPRLSIIICEELRLRPGGVREIRINTSGIWQIFLRGLTVTQNIMRDVIRREEPGRCIWARDSLRGDFFHDRSC